MVKEYGWHAFETVGYATAVNLSQYELFLKQDVDNYVMRLECVPEIRRRDGICMYEAWGSDGYRREAVVLRKWEATALKDQVPAEMYSGDTVYHTGEFQCIRMDWAPLEGEGIGSRPNSEYPVWYLLIGRIAQPSKIKSLWKLDELPYARWAKVHGFQVFRDFWYQGLRPCPEADGDNDIDEVDEAGFHGVGYLVSNKLEEDRLRYYKTLLFQVEPCKITLQALTEHGKEHTVNALTFVLYEEEDDTEGMDKSPDARDPDTTSIEGAGTASIEEGPVSDQPRNGDTGIDNATLLDKPPPLRPRRRRFPILRDVGRPARASDFKEKLKLLQSPNRPRSTLMDVVNAKNLVTPPESPAKDKECEEECEGESEYEGCTESIYGCPPPYPQIVFEEERPWWNQDQGSVKSKQMENEESDNRTDTFESEGAWMGSGRKASALSKSAGVVSTTPTVNKQSLPVRKRSYEHEEPSPEPEMPTVTDEEVSEDSGKVEDMGIDPEQPVS
jgi:hypothetical protein